MNTRYHVARMPGNFQIMIVCIKCQFKVMFQYSCDSRSHYVLLTLEQYSRVEYSGVELSNILLPFIYLFNYLFIGMESLTFILSFGLQYNTTWFILLLKLFQFWSPGAVSSGSCVPLTYARHCGVCVCVCVCVCAHMHKRVCV